MALSYIELLFLITLRNSVKSQSIVVPVIFFLVNDSHFHYTLGMDISFKTKGVCAQMIHFTKNDDGTITNISFDGGCNGNLKAIAKLCDGMQADQIIKKLAGNTCGFKSTSCADQFAKALSEN